MAVYICWISCKLLPRQRGKTKCLTNWTCSFFVWPSISRQRQPVSADGNYEKMVIRTCALDSGSLTLDTELVRMSHCGSFVLDGRSATDISIKSTPPFSFCSKSQIQYRKTVRKSRCVSTTYDRSLSIAINPTCVRSIYFKLSIFQRRSCVSNGALSSTIRSRTKIKWIA